MTSPFPGCSILLGKAIDIHADLDLGADTSKLAENAPAYIARQLLELDSEEARNPSQHRGSAVSTNTLDSGVSVSGPSNFRHVQSGMISNPSDFRDFASSPSEEDEAALSAPAHHGPIVSRAGATWLKEQWARVEKGDAGCASPHALEWENLLAISRIYFDGCIALAESQTAALRETYLTTRDEHKPTYERTHGMVTGGHIFEEYELFLEGKGSLHGCAGDCRQSARANLVHLC